MLIYEVSLQLSSDIRGEFMSWLTEGHIQAVLRSPGFRKAQLLVDKEDDSRVCVRYQVASPQDIEHYTEHLAPELRQDGLDKFGDKFAASRRIFTEGVTFFPANES